MKVKLKKNEFTATLNDIHHGESGGIGIKTLDTREGKLHIAPGEYMIETSFGEVFAVTEAQFGEFFKEDKPPKEKPKKPAKGKE